MRLKASEIVIIWKQQLPNPQIRSSPRRVNFFTKTENEVKIQLTADVTIESAANNWATRKRFTVLSSSITNDAGTRVLMPAGTIVVASLVDGKTVYEVEGKPTDEQRTSALRSVISLHSVTVFNDFINL